MRNTSSSFKSPARFILVCLIPLLLLSCSFSYRPSLGYRPPASVFTPVNHWLYRGSQPTDRDLERFQANGIRTIVNFRDESDLIEQERQKVETLGMKYVSLPWDITKPVKPELLDRFFEVLDDPANRPILFHCKHGRDRSGVMTTLALMRYEKLSENEAREFALETIRPNPLYSRSVDKKIKFFLTGTVLGGTGLAELKGSPPEPSPSEQALNSSSG